MAAQPRRGRALRTLLQDETSRATARDAIAAATAVVRVPVVVVIPSPRTWLDRLPGTADDPPDERDFDAAAMYVAGLADLLAGHDIAAVLMREAAGSPERETEAYEPIANAAAHLRVPIGVWTADRGCWPDGDARGVDFWIGSAPPSGDPGPWGLTGSLAPELPDGSAGAPRVVGIPGDADPDAVASTVRSWG